jgi:hypothetical protein
VTKKALQKQIDELRSRVEFIENKQWAWTVLPQLPFPYVPHVQPQIPYVGDTVPYPGGTTTVGITKINGINC